MSNLRTHMYVYDPSPSVYRDVAMAFLSHTTWKKSMRVSVMKKDNHGRNQIVTPMRMLIEYMPGAVKSFYLLYIILVWCEYQHTPAVMCTYLYIECGAYGNYTSQKLILTTELWSSSVEQWLLTCIKDKGCLK